MPNKQCSSTPGYGLGVSTVTGSTNRRKMHHHRNQLIRDPKAKPIADSSPSIRSVNSSTGACPSSVRVANFLIEFRYFKFRLTLVSRRKQSLQSFYSSPSQSDSSVRPSHQLIQVEHQPSKHPGAMRRTGPHLPVHQPPVSITSSSSCSSTARATESTQNPSQGAEFVYFMEDLLPSLSSNLAINSVPNVNYHCLIYLNEALCHSLLINNGKVLVVDNPIPGKPMDLSATSPCVSISPVVLPKKTKVYDQSLICLFKQSTVAPLQTPRLFETNRDLVRGGLLGPSRTFQKPPLTINSESNDSDEEHEDGSLRSSDPVLVNGTIDTGVESEMSSEPDHDRSQKRQTNSRIYSDEHKSTEEDDEDRLLCSSSHNRQYRNNRQTVANETKKKRFGRERASERSRPRRNDRRDNRQRGRFNVDELDTDSEMTDELGPESDDRLCEILNELHHKPLNSMIKYIRNKLLLKRAHIEQRNELVGEMERILRDNHFNCRLYMFGSTKNWLGLKSSSDIDIFVRLRDRNNRSVDESLMSYTKIERVLNQIDEILTSNQLLLARMLAKHCGEENSPDESDESDVSDDETTVTTTGRHSPSSVRTHSMNGISENVHIQVICHRHMRVPICRLKFSKSSIVAAVDRGVSGVGRGSDGISKRTKPVPVSTADEDEVGGLRVHTTNEHLLQCDLNVNNALGIANTRFIRFLCKFEPRFLVLNVLLRFWSKHVAGLNRPDALSSYALTNLVLYFFQTRVPSILPPVDYFVKLSTEQRIINDWRCDFCKDMSLIHYRTDNTESVIDLLIGFFRFYERFNFVGCKISTRYAKAWKLRRMANTGNGSRGRHVDRLPFVHLMDPFEQCHNLTSRMRSKKFNRMCQQFRLAAIRYEKYL